MTAEFTTLARLARNDQLGVVARQYVFYDSQPQTDPSVPAGTPAVDAKEAFGKSWNVVGGNTFTRVGNDNIRTIVIGSPAKRNVSVLRRIANCIRQQVDNHRFDLGGIPGKLGNGLHVDGYSGNVCMTCIGLAGSIHEARNVNRVIRRGLSGALKS